LLSAQPHKLPAIIFIEKRMMSPAAIQLSSPVASHSWTYRVYTSINGTRMTQMERINRIFTYCEAVSSVFIRLPGWAY